MMVASRNVSLVGTYTGVHSLMRLHRIQAVDELTWGKITCLFSLTSNRISVFPAIMNIGTNHRSIRNVYNFGHQ